MQLDTDAIGTSVWMGDDPGYMEMVFSNQSDFVADEPVTGDVAADAATDSLADEVDLVDDRGTNATKGERGVAVQRWKGVPPVVPEEVQRRGLRRLIEKLEARGLQEGVDFEVVDGQIAM